MQGRALPGTIDVVLGRSAPPSKNLNHWQPLLDERRKAPNNFSAYI